MAYRIPYIMAAASLNAATVLFDAGATAAVIEIRTGAPPTECEDADTGTLLASLTMSDPAFAAASDQNPGARAVANAITGDTSADATGVAGHFRSKDSNGVVVGQGTVTATGGGGDMEINNVNIQAGAQVDITSYTKDMPEV